MFQHPLFVGPVATGCASHRARHVTVPVLRLAITLALLWSIQADAGPLQVAVHAGVTSPTGDFSQVAGNGLHLGLAVAGLDSARSAIGVALNYDGFGEKTQAFDIFGLAQAVTTTRPTVFEAAPFARVTLAPKRWPLAPYLKGGFGADYVVTDITLALSSSTPGVTVTPYSSTRGKKTWLGLFGGIGLMVPTSHSTGLNVEGLFRQMRTGSDQFNSYTIALELWVTP